MDAMDMVVEKDASLDSRGPRMRPQCRQPAVLLQVTAPALGHTVLRLPRAVAVVPCHLTGHGGMRRASQPACCCYPKPWG